MTRPTVYDNLPNPFEGDPMPMPLPKPTPDDIYVFAENKKEEESKRNLLFALLAMALYTSLKITGLVCATLIILNNPNAYQYLAVGAILFLATLTARFEFNPSKKEIKPRVTK